MVVRPDSMMRNVVMNKGIRQVFAGRGVATCEGGLPIQAVKKVLESRLYSFFYSPQFSHKRTGSYSIDGKSLGATLGFAGWFIHTDSKKKEYELICVRVIEGIKVHFYLMHFKLLLSAPQDLSELVVDHVEIDAGQFGDEIQNLQTNGVFFQNQHHFLLFAQTNTDRILKRYVFSLSTEEETQDDSEIEVKFKLEYEMSESSFSGLYQMIDGQIFSRGEGSFSASDGFSTPSVIAQSDISASPYHSISIKFTLSPAALANVDFFGSKLFDVYPDERAIYEDGSTANKYLSAFSQKIEYTFFYKGHALAQEVFKQNFATYNNDDDNWQEKLRRVHDYNCTTHSDAASAKNFYSSRFDLRHIDGNTYLIDNMFSGLFSRHPESLNVNLVTFGTTSRSMPSRGITEFPYTWSNALLIKVECSDGTLNKETISPIARLCCIFAPRKEDETEFKTLYVLLNEDFFEKKEAYDNAKKELAENQGSSKTDMLKAKVAEKKLEFENSYEIKHNMLDTSQKALPDLIYQIKGFGITYITGL